MPNSVQKEAHRCQVRSRFCGILPLKIQGQFCHLQRLNDEGENLSGKRRDDEVFRNQLREMCTEALG